MSDTYGLEANNGVGRFLYDLRARAEEHALPFSLVVPGKNDRQPGVHCIRAPSFMLPGYSDLRISIPLEHHRKTVVREMKLWRPDALHVSTPGPLGCFGITLAQQLRLPLVGIYHTDFPSYARALVRQQLAKWRERPGLLLEPLSSLISSGDWLPYVEELRRANAQFDADRDMLIDIAKRNLNAVAGGSDLISLGGELAYAAMARVLKRFYAKFTFVVARSYSQQEHLQKLGIEPERIRCLTPGTDVQRFDPRYEDREIWQRFGVPKRAFVALYVGRATSEKNFDFLLSVWKRLLQNQQSTDRDIRLVIVGHGERATLEHATDQPGIHAIGAQRGETLSTLYASSDVLLFPSVTETLGQVGLEAGASGLPAIVSDRGGPQMYVRDGNTGFVLSTDDAGLWAQQLLTLARDESLRSRLAFQARDHITANHTLETSLRSYWDIHREAVELASRKPKRKRKDATPSCSAQESSEARPGLLVITDYHAGKRFGNEKQRKHKEAALEKMLQRAVDARLDVVFGGDFGDHGARPDRAEADFALLRRVRERVGLKASPVFVRGNHDYGYTDEQLVELTGGCRVHDSLVYTHATAGVTVTHGHILGLRSVQEVLRRVEGCAAIQQALREDALDDELTPSVIAYDLANLVESYTRRMGLTGLGTFWEGLFKTRGLVAEALLAYGRRNQANDERTWKLIASLVGSHDDVETAAMLGVACGSWATVFGHTHEPLAEKLRLPLSGEAPAVAHLVGNAGSMNRKHPSCIMVRFPEVRVYRYKSESKQLRVSHAARLDASELETDTTQPVLRALVSQAWADSSQVLGDA